ncbi:sialate O-acetylesterase [Segetibacter sp. 3557_3]|uniref:sialate O-acetylesterase n=1 Tax=Segetibacter sp. 3557_3 TaxID=2547429 RepID=UPI001058E68F|nr:sialate O-acetylesterase [Segetibacter sp. 3557_3]TDH27453.1 sialate O-acetylesterase [Segetibacter sp. 3557_3]
MVLQQNKPLPIWGNAQPGEKVSVSFANQSRSVITGGTGKWLVTLDPLTASEQPREFIIKGNNTITLKNVLVGEVWLASGQSNMEYTMRKNSKVVTTDSANLNSPVNELQRANNASIRIFLVTSKNLRKPDSTHSGWSTARDSALRSFSAVAYFFAKELYDKLHVPIGMISSAIPGSAIEPWLPGTPQTYGSKAIQLDESNPGKFYTTMVGPLAPYAIKGFLWYQGETNCFQNETTEYRQKLAALIWGWRKQWTDEKLPFYYVQIAPFYYSKSAGKYPLTKETLPKFWEAQALVMQLPNTGMAVITGTVKNPEDLHPGTKWEVGRRLAQWPLAKDYNINVVPSGPIFRSKKLAGNTLELSFDYVGQGLVSKDRLPLTHFVVAGADKRFVPATAFIKGDKVIVSAEGVSRPMEVRFAWDETADPNFSNKDGLPAMPFRTDGVPTASFK